MPLCVLSESTDPLRVIVPFGAVIVIDPAGFAALVVMVEPAAADTLPPAVKVIVPPVAPVGVPPPWVAETVEAPSRMMSPPASIVTDPPEHELPFAVACAPAASVTLPPASRRTAPPPPFATLVHEPAAWFEETTPALPTPIAPPAVTVTLPPLRPAPAVLALSTPSSCAAPLTVMLIGPPPQEPPVDEMVEPAGAVIDGAVMLIAPPVAETHVPAALELAETTAAAPSVTAPPDGSVIAPPARPGDALVVETVPFSDRAPPELMVIGPPAQPLLPAAVPREVIDDPAPAVNEEPVRFTAPPAPAPQLFAEVSALMVPLTFSAPLALTVTGPPLRTPEPLADVLIVPPIVDAPPDVIETVPPEHAVLEVAEIVPDWVNAPDVLRVIALPHASAVLFAVIWAVPWSVNGPPDAFSVIVGAAPVVTPTIADPVWSTMPLGASAGVVMLKSTPAFSVTVTPEFTWRLRPGSSVAVRSAAMVWFVWYSHVVPFCTAWIETQLES